MIDFMKAKINVINVKFRLTDGYLRSVLCVGLVGGKTNAKPVLYEGGIFTHYTRLEARKKKKKK